jgi:hypothetical protein
LTQCTERGDSVVGEILVAEARVVSKPVLVHLTGAHRGQRLKLKGLPATCWIDRPFREKH